MTDWFNNTESFSRIGDIVRWLAEFPFPFIFFLACAGIFLCAVIILVFRDTLRLLAILIRGTSVTSQFTPLRIINEGGAKKILIAGDSTAVGTGAQRSEDTLMGMFAHDFPHVEIQNVGVNGALTKHVIAQLKKVEHTHFSLALISTGGNDVWRLTPLRQLAEDLNIVLQRALSLTDGKVVLLIYSNIGSAPVFPIFFRDYLIHRSAIVNEMFRQIADHYNIQYAEIFTEKTSNPFVHHPNEFFAHDSIHPSAKGYRLWYNRLWRILVTRNYDLS